MTQPPSNTTTDNTYTNPTPALSETSIAWIAAYTVTATVFIVGGIMTLLYATAGLSGALPAILVLLGFPGIVVAGPVMTKVLLRTINNRLPNPSTENHSPVTPPEPTKH